jgi:ATP-dependent DNA ligase
MDTAQLTLVRQPFDHPDFLFELKHDGFRALAHI